MALSGSTSKAYTPKGAYWIWIEWSATQDILANQSTITAILYIGTNSYGYYTTNDNESKITIDGVTASFGDSGDVGYNTVKREISRYTRTVSHNSDGTKSLTLTGWQRLSDTYQLTTTGTITLDTIPRASLITSFPAFTIGNGVTAYAPRYSTSFTNTYSIYVGGTHIATKSGQGDSCTFSGAELDGIYATIPNAVSTTATLYVTTYSGGTQIGSTQSAGATASVGADIIPTFSAVVAEETETAVANLGLGSGNYVQNLSRIRFTVTGASGAKSSWITSYRITFNGVNYTSNPSTTGAINVTGTLTATATVTDSRGRTSTSKTVNCNLIAYSTPTISAFSAFRSDSSGNAAPLGTYAKLSAVGSIASISSRNQITYKIESKLRSGSTWTTHVNTSLPAGTTTLSISPIYYTFAATSSYDLKLTLSDKFNTITSQISLPTGEVALSWGKTGVGIGKVWEQGGLDVAGTFYLNGEPVTAVNKALDSGTDLNTVTTSGWYRLSGSHSNAPSNYAYGQMLVIHGAFDTIAQLLFPYNDDTVWRRSGNPTNVGGSGAWRSWTQVGGGSYLPLSGGTLSGNLTVPSVYTSNWFRSTGASGWYSETYGGGWYMTDSSWIRAYNNKGVHTGGILSADGGLNIGAGTDINLYASGSSPSDPGDLVFRNSSGSELSRLYHLSDGLYYRLNGSGGGKVFTNEFLRSGTVYLTNASWTSVSYSYLGGTIRVLGMGITNVSGESYMKVRNISSTGFEAVVGGTGTANTFNWVAIGT